jgi:hypothetical protein
LDRGAPIPSAIAAIQRNWRRSCRTAGVPPAVFCPRTHTDPHGPNSASPASAPAGRNWNLNRRERRDYAERRRAISDRRPLGVLGANLCVLCGLDHLWRPSGAVPRQCASVWVRGQKAAPSRLGPSSFVHAPGGGPAGSALFRPGMGAARSWPPPGRGRNDDGSASRHGDLRPGGRDRLVLGRGARAECGPACGVEIRRPAGGARPIVRIEV